MSGFKNLKEGEYVRQTRLGIDASSRSIKMSGIIVRYKKNDRRLS